MIERYGWTLLFHECIVEHMRKLAAAVDQAKLQGPQGFEANANVKLFRAHTHVRLQAVPGDPNRDEYRQGNTTGPAFRHWHRAKVGQRFRLFFRFDSKVKIIVFAWVNYEKNPAVGRKRDGSIRGVPENAGARQSCR